MSAPTSVWVVFSHFTWGLASSMGLAPNCSVSPVPNTAFRFPVTIGTPGYAPILSLPVSPQLARSLKAENGPFSALKLRASWGETRSEEHTSELQSQSNLVCRLLLEKKKLRPRHAISRARPLPAA